MTSLDESIDWNKGNGLVPAIVQHVVTARVLMLGYMNREALAATQSSNLVTFYSRSRDCLWTKGETSGHRLLLRDIEVDCDGDTILVQAMPDGPTCHRQTSSCFGHDVEQPGFGFIGQLESIIRQRKNASPAESYTAKLMLAGTQRIAQKIGEEGVEVALAAMQGDRQKITSETADLIYHVMVLLAHQDLQIADVVHHLETRHCNSNLRASQAGAPPNS